MKVKRAPLQFKARGTGAREARGRVAALVAAELQRALVFLRAADAIIAQHVPNVAKALIGLHVSEIHDYLYL